MKRICFVGASTTEGMGDRTGRGWIGNLTITVEQRAVCYNLGIRGQTIFQVAERGPTECRARILPQTPGAIVLGCTLNDLAWLADGERRFDYSRIKDCYLELITELSAVAPTVVIGPPPVLHEKMPFFSAVTGSSLDFRNPDINDHDQSISLLCSSLAVPYIAVFSSLIESEPYQAGLTENDGLHTNSDGYRAMASLIEQSAVWSNFINL